MPTIKHRMAFKEVLKGSTLSAAMIKAGYSKTTASTTGKLTNTKGWQELMDTNLSDKRLSEVHKKLLNKTERIVVSDGKEGSHIEETGQPHSDSAKALDMAYKLKGRYNETSYFDNRHINIIISPDKARRLENIRVSEESEG